MGGLMAECLFCLRNGLEHLLKRFLVILLKIPEAWKGNLLGLNLRNSQAGMNLLLMIKNFWKNQ
jgi:hypothetical protein